jgi:hypothetical protein
MWRRFGAVGTGCCGVIAITLVAAGWRPGDATPPDSPALAARLDAAKAEAGTDGALAPAVVGVMCDGPCPQPPGTPLIEVDPCPFNTVNCGCDCNPPTYSGMECGQSYCAKAWNSGSIRDTDWFLLTVSDTNMDGTEYVCLTLTSPFPAVMELYSGTCGSLVLEAQGLSDNCSPTTICDCLAAPGQYRVKVYPDVTAPLIFCPGEEYTLETFCTRCPNEGKGACCFRKDNTDIIHCVNPVSQYDCENLYHGRFLGNVPCPPSGRCCIKPPDGLLGWWPMDETSGRKAHDVVYRRHLSYQPNLPPNNGPTPTAAGQVSGALCFDGVDDYLARAAAEHDVGNGEFTLDAWVNPTSLHPTIPNTIVERRNGAGTGYHLYVNGAGALCLEIDPVTGGPCTLCSTAAAVPVGVWTNVAATVSQNFGGGRAIGLYVNKVLNKGLGIRCGDGDLSAPGLVLLYAGLGVHVPGGPGRWHGYIDELELFKRELTLDDIALIYWNNKCKQRCHVPIIRSFCAGLTNVVVPVTVFNDDAAARSILLTFTPIVLPGGTCWPAPPTFTIITGGGTNPVTVPAYGYAVVQVRISKPAGMTPPFKVCYRVTVTNQTTGQSCICDGMIVDRPDNWPEDDFQPPTQGTVGTALTVDITLTDTDGGGTTATGRLGMVDTSDMSTSYLARLNGNPPGTPVGVPIMIPPDGTETISTEVEFVDDDPLGFVDLVLSTDTDGDGVYEPLTSRGFTSSRVPPCPADCAPPPDGEVNVTDLLTLLGSWGSGEVCDLNGDGVINVIDLLVMLGAWGPCP